MKRTLRAAAVAPLLVMLACSQDPQAPKPSADAVGTMKMALTGVEAEFKISGVAFSATSAAGQTTSAVIPLEAEPLPAARDAEHAGAGFADWLVVLPAGAYEISAMPLGPNGQPSEKCVAAKTQANIVPAATTEVLLEARCGAQANGALDATLVFTKGPVIENLRVESRKFVCAHEAFAATVALADSKPATPWQWEVLAVPEGANASDTCLSWANGRVAFTAQVPGKYELRVQVGEGAASTALSFPVYVSDCGKPQQCLGTTAQVALKQPPTASAGACDCGNSTQPATTLTGVEIKLDDVFYADGKSASVTLNMGARDTGAATMDVVLSVPGTQDAEPVTLSRVANGLYRGDTGIALRHEGEATPADGTLVVGAGKPFFAMYFPDKTQPALTDLPVDYFSDVAFLDDPNAAVAEVEPRLALTDDESGGKAKPAGTLLRKGGMPVQIAAEEVMVWVRNDDELQAFVAQSGGKVLSKQDLDPADNNAPSYAQVALVKVTPAAEAGRRLATLDAFLGETQPLLVSQAAVAALVAQVITWRLDGWAVAVNPRLQYQGAPSISAAEATPLTHTMQLTAGCRPGDASRPCFENVPALWAWTALWDKDTSRVNVAVLDMGFAPNADFRTPAVGPSRECDMSGLSGPVCGPGRAQGSPTVGNSFFGERSWHGTGVVTTMGGVVNNGFGAAGVAGQVAVPMLYKYDALAYVFEVGGGMRQATNDGASCINISGGYPCRIMMNFGPDFDICSEAGRLGICSVVTAAAASAAAAVCLATGWIPFAGAIACGVATGAVVAATSACISTLAFGNLAGPMHAGAQYAHRRGVPVVVSSGNALSRDTLPEVIRDLVDLSNHSSDDWRVMPAVIPQTISVGAVDDSLGNVHFFGNTVDVWAPIRSTYFAPSDVNNPASTLVQTSIGGTSAAAPYVTGLIAVMQAANRDLNPNTPGLSDAQKRTIVERIRSLLRNNSFTNAQLVAGGFANQPVERPRLVNPLATVMAAAGTSVPDVAALGYDTSLGFGELDANDDTAAQARLLLPGVERTGTILTLRGEAPFTPVPDVDFYAFDMPAGARPMEADVTLTFPEAHGSLSLSGAGFRLISRGGDTVVYRVVANAGARVVFSVQGGSGQDNVYKLRFVARPAVPLVRIVSPLDADAFEVCANEDVTLRAQAEFQGSPLTVAGTAMQWTSGSMTLGNGNPLVRQFAVGVHDVAVQAYGDPASRDVIRLTARVCISNAPTGNIISPATNSGVDNPAYAYDGFDEARGMWFKDVVVEAVASDIEDGALSGASIVWKTNQTGVQAEVLGTGARLTVRLYSNSCFGTEHVITAEAIDSDGNRTALGARRILIWTLC